jgi:hypothetical protein
MPLEGPERFNHIPERRSRGGPRAKQVFGRKGVSAEEKTQTKKYNPAESDPELGKLEQELSDMREMIANPSFRSGDNRRDIEIREEAVDNKRKQLGLPPRYS